MLSNFLKACLEDSLCGLFIQIYVKFSNLAFPTLTKGTQIIAREEMTNMNQKVWCLFFYEDIYMGYWQSDLTLETVVSPIREFCQWKRRKDTAC